MVESVKSVQLVESVTKLTYCGESTGSGTSGFVIPKKILIGFKIHLPVGTTYWQKIILSCMLSAVRDAMLTQLTLLQTLNILYCSTDINLPNHQIVQPTGILPVSQKCQWPGYPGQGNW